MPEFDYDAPVREWRPDWNDAVREARARAATTCFCPGGGGDWQPLIKLSHFCDTFIYADLCADGEQAAALRRFFENIYEEPGVGRTFRCEEARELDLGCEACPLEADMGHFLEQHSPADAAAYRQVIEPLADQARWGLEVKLGGLHWESQAIRVLFFQMEALACYRGLYADARLAPQVLMLPPQQGRQTARSRQLSLNGPLGAVLRAEPHAALVVAALDDEAALTGTAWPHRWNTLMDCHRAAFTRWPLPPQWWKDAVEWL